MNIVNVKYKTDFSPMKKPSQRMGTLDTIIGSYCPGIDTPTMMSPPAKQMESTAFQQCLWFCFSWIVILHHTH